MNSIPMIWFLVPLSAVIALLASKLFQVKDNGSANSKTTEPRVGLSLYRPALPVFLGGFLLILGMVFMGLQVPFAPITFLLGGMVSILSGLITANISKRSSAQSTAASQQSLSAGLRVSLRSSARIELSTLGLALLGISICFALIEYFYSNNLLGISQSIIQAFGQSEWNSSIARHPLFIQEKFKVLSYTLLSFSLGASIMALFSTLSTSKESKITSISSDFFDSYVGSILASTVLGSSLAFASGQMNTNFIVSPMLVAGLAVLGSIVGCLIIRPRDTADEKTVRRSILLSRTITTLVIVVACAGMAYWSLIGWGVFGAFCSGVVAAIIIGRFSVPAIDNGSSSNISTAWIQGIRSAMLSTWIPVITIAASIMASFLFSGGLDSIQAGIYGIAFASLGLLCAPGSTLSYSALGSITTAVPEDNDSTKTLISLGSTHGTSGRRVAIAASSLTGISLIAAYLDSIKFWIATFAGKGSFYLGQMGFTRNPNIALPGSNIFAIEYIQISDLLVILKVTILNPSFLIGLLLGSALAFMICALNSFSSDSKSRYRLRPDAVTMLAPILIGLILGVTGVLGLLTGALISSLCLALIINTITNNNTLNTSLVSGTGDGSLKDTAGPSLNILIKLMTIMSVVFLGFILKFGIML